MTEEQRAILARHLFPDDGLEAVAILLCGRASGPHIQRLLVREIVLIPYSACKERRTDRVTWPTELLEPHLNRAAKYNWAMVKIHGHRSFADFSSTDDVSDRELFPGVYAWIDGSGPHASAILMDDGRVFGRVVAPSGEFSTLDRVSVVGDDIRVFDHYDADATGVPDFGRRVAQTFGSRTFSLLRKLKIAVVGCSGTGSPVIEMLARSCVGSLLLIDPDHIEEKNLNRIFNSTMEDARLGTSKVVVAKRAIEAMGLGTKVDVAEETLFSPDIIRAIAACDVVFGCVDTIDGRYLLNKLASFYMLPYFDLGVKIEADGLGGVNQVVGSVHYLKPGGSSLLSRHVISLEQVRSAGLLRTDPDRYKQQLQEGYIRGVQEDRPAVIQLNTLIASFAVNELLARLHPYRLDPNGDFAVTRISLSHGIFEHENDGEACSVLARHLGRGDVTPLLDWAELSAQGAAL